MFSRIHQIRVLTSARLHRSGFYWGVENAETGISSRRIEDHISALKDANVNFNDDFVASEFGEHSLTSESASETSTKCS